MDNAFKRRKTSYLYVQGYELRLRYDECTEEIPF